MVIQDPPKGEQIVWEQEVDLSEEGGFEAAGALEAYILENRLRSMRNHVAEQAYVDQVAADILSEYYGDHDAK